ncbi:hypothetical protein [Bacillus thuringiensis]|uniref:hypothetical protein n=1 Tax=Bacillus thuringiensis TaxID=1428 RepID=UPI0001A1E7E3|nr:hypothetical protein [Bacillus thuringiensis]EEM86062.1 hypothetical protein bthur0012_59600 [Bacillus thuringiensis serovar pulsiensis BGSC 4CC1]
MNNVITETIEPLWGHSYRYEINGKIPCDGVNPDVYADKRRSHEKWATSPKGEICPK